MERGCDPENALKGGLHGCYARVEEMVPLHEVTGLQT